MATVVDVRGFARWTEFAAVLVSRYEVVEYVVLRPGDDLGAQIGRLPRTPEACAANGHPHGNPVDEATAAREGIPAEAVCFREALADWASERIRAQIESTGIRSYRLIAYQPGGGSIGSARLTVAAPPSPSAAMPPGVPEIEPPPPPPPPPPAPAPSASMLLDTDPLSSMPGVYDDEEEEDEEGDEEEEAPAPRKRKKKAKNKVRGAPVSYRVGGKHVAAAFAFPQMDDGFDLDLPDADEVDLGDDIVSRAVAAFGMLNRATVSHLRMVHASQRAQLAAWESLGTAAARALEVQTGANMHLIDHISATKLDHAQQQLDHADKANKTALASDLGKSAMDNFGRFAQTKVLVGALERGQVDADTVVRAVVGGQVPGGDAKAEKKPEEKVEEKAEEKVEEKATNAIKEEAEAAGLSAAELDAADFITTHPHLVDLVNDPNIRAKLSDPAEIEKLKMILQAAAAFGG